MKKFYTAIGQMKMRRLDDGAGFPVVTVGGEETTPDVGEMILWSTLYWNFLTAEELEMRYEAKKNEVHSTDSRSTSGVLYWMLRKGLVAEGSGNTPEEALYDLLAGLYLTPISENPLLRAGSFLNLVCREGCPVREAAKVLQRDRRSEGEKTVMRSIRHVRLSAAEVIRCIERGVPDLRNEGEIVEKLYADDSTTDMNIADEMRHSPVRREVLTDVANLYLRRQLVFDKA